MSVIKVSKNCKRNFEINQQQEVAVVPWFLFGKVPDYYWYRTHCPYCGLKNYNRPVKDA